MTMKQVAHTTDKCIPWHMGHFASGYGSWYVDGKAYRAHRIVYEMEHGSIPKGMHVCHTCDNPGCVNIAHLFLGTHLDNMRDKVQKGRQPRMNRTNHPATKLTPKICQQIQEEYTGKRGEINMLAEKYNVHRATIRGALHYEY